MGTQARKPVLYSRCKSRPINGCLSYETAVADWMQRHSKARGYIVGGDNGTQHTKTCATPRDIAIDTGAVVLSDPVSRAVQLAMVAPGQFAPGNCNKVAASS